MAITNTSAPTLFASKYGDGDDDMRIQMKPSIIALNLPAKLNKNSNISNLPIDLFIYKS